MSKGESEDRAEAAALESALTELIDLSLPTAPGPGHAFWRKVQSINELFRQSRSLDRASRERLRSQLDGICRIAKEQQSQRSQASERSRERLLDELEEIERLLNQEFTGMIFSEPNFREFHSKMNELRTRLQQEPGLLKADKDKLWGKFKDMQHKAYDLRQRKTERENSHSRRRLDRIKSLVSEAELTLRWGRESEHELKSAGEKLKTAFLWVKGDESFLAVVGKGFHDRFNKEDYQEAFSIWKEARIRLTEAWAELHRANFTELLEIAENAVTYAEQGSTREASQKIREVRTGMRERSLGSSDRQDINERLARAHELIGERYREKKEAFVSRLSEQRDKKVDLLDRVSNQISELRDRESEARSESYADRVRDWIRQKEDFYARLQEQIDEIEEKLRDAEDS